MGAEVTPVPSVAVVCLRNDTVLLVHHLNRSELARDQYGLPAGKILPGESEEGAGAKKLHQETGLTAGLLIKLPTTYIADIRQADNLLTTFSMVVFKAVSASGEVNDHIDRGEVEPVWVAINNLPELDLLPNTIEAVNEAINVN